jgi:glycosyltransferase involved in cell wall biosynthesis
MNIKKEDNNINKNVLIVIPTIKKGGGAQYIASKIIRKLPKSFYANVITFQSTENEYSMEGNRFNIANTNENSDNLWHKIKIFLGHIYYIRKIIKENNIDIVISFLKKACIPMIFASFMNDKIKTIAAIRNNPRAKFGNLIGRLAAFLYRFADQVVTNSIAAEKICQKEYGMKNTTTIHNPVNYKQIKENKKEIIPERYKQIFNSRKTFINVGRLSKQKGQWHLVRAFSRVVEDNPDANLVILGTGDLRKKLEKLISNCGIEDRVFLLGYQDNVFPFLKASDCFVLSSMHEGLPNVVLEAKAVGLPVISVDCGTGPREILAPELDYNEDISYPYRIDKHTIAKPLSGKKIFKSASENSLEAAEKILAKAMKEKIKKGFEQKQFEYDERFDPKQIFNKWVKIL